MDILAALLRICCDAVNAVDAESIETVHHDLCRLEAALCHYRLHCIELHLSLLRRHRHAKVVTDDLVADLVHHLWNNRINLTWHD